MGPRGDIQGKREIRARRGVRRAAHRDPPEGQGHSMTPFRSAAAWRLDEPRTQAERLASFVSRAKLGIDLPGRPGGAEDPRPRFPRLRVRAITGNPCGC